MHKFNLLIDVLEFILHEKTKSSDPAVHGRAIELKTKIGALRFADAEYGIKEEA